MCFPLLPQPREQVIRSRSQSCAVLSFSFWGKGESAIRADKYFRTLAFRLKEVGVGRDVDMPTNTHAYTHTLSHPTLDPRYPDSERRMMMVLVCGLYSTSGGTLQLLAERMIMIPPPTYYLTHDRHLPPTSYLSRVSCVFLTLDEESRLGPSNQREANRH